MSIRRAAKPAKKPKPIKLEEVHFQAGEIIEITPDMVIGDVVLAYPISKEILQKNGIHCVGCYASTWESIQEGAMRHNLDPLKLCKKINEAIHVRRDPPSPKSRKR